MSAPLPPTPAFPAPVPPPPAPAHPRVNWPVLGAVLLCVTVAAVLILRRKSDGAVEHWTKAEHRKFQTSLNERGALCANREYDVLAAVAGDITWLCDEGLAVEEGVPIASFDPTVIEADIENQAQTKLDKEETVRRAKKDLELAERRQKTTVDRFKALCDKAKATRDDLYAQPTPEDRLDAELTLKAATLNEAQAKLDYASNFELGEKGYVSGAVVKQKKLALVTTTVDKVKAQTLLDLTKAGATELAKAQADIQVADAEESLRGAQFDTDADISIAKANIELAQVDLENFLRQLAEKQRQHQACTVRSPAHGRVAYVDVWKGSSVLSPIQIGDQRQRGLMICKVVDTSVLRIKVRVGETDIHRVALGQKATVSMPAIPGQVFPAVVAEIGLTAQDKNSALSRSALLKSGEAFVNVIEVTLDFVNPSADDIAKLRIGLTVEAEIFTEAAADTLTVPWSTVRYGADANAYVELRKGGSKERRPVKLGRGNSKYAEVLDGLSAGDEVLDFAPERAEPEAKP